MNGDTGLNEQPTDERVDNPLLGCALNFSEGRELSAIEDIVCAAGVSAAVLDVAPDPDHNRTVVTLGGAPEGLVTAVLGLSTEAVGRIDIRTQQGVHPRLGAVDVVPFYPVFDTAMSVAVDTADRCCRALSARLRLPCFLYELSSRPQGRTLPWIRQNAFTSLLPDHGPGRPHPTAGACVVGARGLLVAYNITLAESDVTVARRIAAQLRAGGSALPGVRSLGLDLPSRRLTQVSVNIIDPLRTTLSDVFERVSTLAAKEGIPIGESELIGLVPRSCLSDADARSLRLSREPHILEDAFAQLR